MFQGTWDAWNRLVKLTEPNGSGGWQTLAEYQYDGQTWRIVAKSYASGVLDETRHFYFTNRWQDIEERLGSTPRFCLKTDLGVLPEIEQAQAWMI